MNNPRSLPNNHLHTPCLRTEQVPSRVLTAQLSGWVMELLCPTRLRQKGTAPQLRLHIKDLRSPSCALSQGFSRDGKNTRSLGSQVIPNRAKACSTKCPCSVPSPPNPYYLEELLRLGMVPKACEEARFCPASDSSSSERLAVPDAIRDESSSP